MIRFALTWLCVCALAASLVAQGLVSYVRRAPVVAAGGGGDIAFVQSAKAYIPSTLAYDSDVTAGSLLVVVFRCGGNHTVTFTDTQSNTYAEAGSIYNGDATMNLSYAMNTSAGANTVTQSGCGGSKMWSVGEYSGVATTSALDQTNSASGTATTFLTGSITTTTADQLIVAGISTDDVEQGVGNGNLDNEREISNLKSTFQDSIVSATGTYEGQWTGSNDGYSGVIASFKAAP